MQPLLLHDPAGVEMLAHEAAEQGLEEGVHVQQEAAEAQLPRRIVQGDRLSVQDQGQEPQCGAIADGASVEAPQRGGDGRAGQGVAAGASSAT